MVLTSALASGSLHGGHGPLHATGVQELRKPPANDPMQHLDSFLTSTHLLLVYYYYMLYIEYIYIGYDINISFRFITYCIAPKKVDPSLGHVQIFTNGSTKSTNHQK